MRWSCLIVKSVEGNQQVWHFSGKRDAFSDPIKKEGGRQEVNGKDDPSNPDGKWAKMVEDEGQIIGRAG